MIHIFDLAESHWLSMYTLSLNTNYSITIFPQPFHYIIWILFDDGTSDSIEFSCISLLILFARLPSAQRKAKQIILVALRAVSIRSKLCSTSHIQFPS